MTQLEMPNSKGTADDRSLFKGDADVVFTLAGLDDDWESIELRPSPTVGQGHAFLDIDELCFVPLCLDAPLTDFLHHANDRSDFSWYHNLGAGLDQAVLDLDSDYDEMDKGGMVLDF